MKISFKTIQIHNFMSFKDEVFDFDGVAGLVLIRGKNNDIPNETNGAGKSTLGYSLLYTLFGQLQNKIKNENIVNRQADDRDMRLVLDFSVDDLCYRIERGLQRGRLSYLNLFSVTDTGETDLTKSTIQETQSFIEDEILKCDISIFLRTVLLTADQTYNFYTMKKQDKKEFIEKLFDIGVFGDMHAKIHKDLLTLDKQAIAKQNQLLILNQNVSTYRDKSENFEKTHAVRLAELKSSLAAAEAQHRQIVGTEATVNMQAVTKLNEAMEKLDAAALKYEHKKIELAGKTDKVRFKLNENERQMKKYQAQIDKHSELVSRLCNDCRDVFKKYYSLDEYSSNIDEIIKQNSELKTKLAEYEKTESDIVSGKKLISEKQHLAQARLADLTREASLVQNKMCAAERAVAAAKTELESETKRVNPYVELVGQSEIDEKTAVRDLENLTKKIKYLTLAESVVSQDTLRKFIIRDLIGILNNRIRKYLVKLGAKYYVKFDDEMEYEFVPTVGTCEFGNFSAGERMRLMIATSFAFRDFMSIRNGLYSNILILDEYFDGAISSAGIESLMNILKEYKTEQEQNIFIISQRPEVQLDAFDRIVQIEKTNGISRVTFI